MLNKKRWRVECRESKMLVKKKRKQNGRSRFGRRLLILEITRLQKKNLPGEI
jgi:hypothetical protein